MLKFRKTVPYIPDPVRCKPQISEEDKRLGSQIPPHAVPYHCKPWVDGQTIGWTLFYGYLSSVAIRGNEDGGIDVDNLEQLTKETQQADIISQFAKGHFGIGSGYTLSTLPDISTLILPVSSSPPGLEAIVGLIETDWYPRQIFLVFKVPQPGVEILLEHKTPLARVVMTPRFDELTAQPMTAEEIEEIEGRRQAYLADESTSDSRWVDAAGNSFTHVYKQWSKRHRKGGAGE